MPGIIWLASYPKSGNTWTRAFLANYLADRKTAVPINELPNFCFGDNMASHYTELSGKAEEEIDPETVAEWRERVHLWIANAKAPQDVFVKTHSLIGVMEGRALISPAATAGAIYIVRNPFDVAVSFASHYQVTPSRAVEIMTERDHYLPPSSGQVIQFIGDWSQHVRSWTTVPGLTRHVMRYEDMIAAPKKAFQALVEFLGMPEEKQRLRKAVKFSSFKELSRQESKEKFVESRPDGKSKFFRSGQSGGWRAVLSDDDTARLVDAHRDLLLQFGYLTEDGNITV